MKTSVDTKPVTKARQKASCERQKADKALASKQYIDGLYKEKELEAERKRIWNIGAPSYGLLVKIIYAWYVEGKASSIQSLCGRKSSWSVCNAMREQILKLRDKDLLFYYGECGSRNNGKLWAPTSEALKIFGITETFTDVCA